MRYSQMKNDNGKLSSIKNKSVVDQIIESIICAISEGKYKAGEKLPNEYELINELQISRNSLREAMRVLSTLGILEIKRGDGTYICEQVSPTMFDSIVYGFVLDSSPSSELIELREAFDQILFKMAIEKAKDSDIERLEYYINEMKRNFEQGDAEKASIADYEFHLCLVDICNNRLLSRIIKGVYQFFKESIHENITSEDEFAHAVEYHNEILNLIKTKDRSNIENVAIHSLESWRKHVRK